MYYNLWSVEIFANYFGHISELHIGDLVLQNHAAEQSVKEAVYLRGKKEVILHIKEN